MKLKIINFTSKNKKIFKKKNRNKERKTMSQYKEEIFKRSLLFSLTQVISKLLSIFLTSGDTRIKYKIKKLFSLVFCFFTCFM